MGEDKKPNDYRERLDATRKLWDQEAPTFDQEDDHGLTQPRVKSAWKQLLDNTINIAEKSIALDIGCGTGSLSSLLAELGYQVTGIDLSPAMIRKAKQKAVMQEQSITFFVMDAAYPELEEESFDLILCRHMLWSFSQPERVLPRWLNLLKPNGQLILIEGFWHTGGGLHAQDILKMLPPNTSQPTLKHLGENADLWGRQVNDERYLISTRRVE